NANATLDSSNAKTARDICSSLIRMLVGMRILVTGAAGYIGSALVRALAARAVIGTDQSAPATVLGNIAYPQFARSLVTPEIGTVFHLASLVSGGAEQNFELG